ncbi:MAG: acetate uptake transporter [Acidothermaceae bacterium]
MTTSNGVGTLPRRQVPREQWTKAGPIVSGMPAERVVELQEQSEASIGEPGAMGLFGFAVGTLIVAIPFAGQLPLSAVPAALPPVLLFAGIAQFIAGLIAFRKGITFAGTAFSCYGANNVVIATFFLFKAAGIFPGDANDLTLLGMELFCFAYISLVLSIAATRVNMEFVGILSTLTVGFALSGVTNVGGPAVVGHIGGWFLFVSAGFAFYGASALVINSAFQRQVLPLLSRA